jgi:hypothetical protein
MESTPMTDTTNAPARSKVSERLLFAGETETSNPADATRAVYKIPANGRSIEYKFGDNPAADRAFANFGFHTKIGNVTNTVRNDKDNQGTPDDEADAAEEFFTALNDNGLWREPSESGPRGPKYDDAILAHVIHAAFAAKGTAKGDVAHYAERLADKAYRAKVLAAAFDGTSVKDLYAAEAAARGITTKAATPRDLDDLA